MDYSTIYSYLLSFAFSTVFLVYLGKLPYLVTGEKELVRLYYNTNYATNIPLDILLIAVYLSVATTLMNWLQISKKMSYQKYGLEFLIVILTTLAISGGFYYYFVSAPITSSFFSRWFHKVGFNAVLYDCILVSFTYGVFRFLQQQFKPLKN